MLFYPFIIAIFFFILAYKIYGTHLVKKFNLSDKNKTPAHTMYDGNDYVPTRKEILLGHHFASIAGAGPIVGPIIAGLAFGWYPAILWIILGSIFLGGVHDFSALVASIKHKSRTVAEIAKTYIGKNAYVMFLLFIWLALVYVLIVFLDLTATTFAAKGEVATTSLLYILLAILFGLSLYKLKLNFSFSTILFVVLVFASIGVGYKFPLTLKPVLFASQDLAIAMKKNWSIILLVYSFIASTAAVWVLLQPRDYLSSFLLYASVLLGAIGIIFGGLKINYPSFISFTSTSGTLFPILFVTIACGAISGFHSIVSSGTTAKQLNKEMDARPIGYGGMLLEGVVAVIALSTVMIAFKGGFIGKTPMQIFASGIGKFGSILGIPEKFGSIFGLLVLSSFLLTTLDTATRLARYALQEMFNWEIQKTKYFATFITLLLPAIFALIDLKDPKGNIVPAWSVIWPVFGASNQLLAALTLLVISVWIVHLKKNSLLTIIPMILMFIVTLTALFQLILLYRFTAVGIIAGILFILALYLIIQSYKALVKRNA
ncbi:MAG: carbon starvation protein A [Spirochaetes bacterium]|nr:carbon starvation protein A [Spirochaetota bacterium]